MLELTDIRDTKVFQEVFEEGLEKGMQEGTEKGMQEGMEKALLQVAIRSLAKGHSIADVAELTGLSVAQVMRLKRRAT